jgi:hypothetical protein
MSGGVATDRQGSGGWKQAAGGANRRAPPLAKSGAEQGTRSVWLVVAVGGGSQCFFLRRGAPVYPLGLAPLLRVLRCFLLFLRGSWLRVSMEIGGLFFSWSQPQALSKAHCVV